MRGQGLIDHVTGVIQNTFHSDVADAFLSDPDTLEKVARHLNDNYGDEGIAPAIEQVADSVDDATADWLVDEAASPTAWLYSKV